MRHRMIERVVQGLLVAAWFSGLVAADRPAHATVTLIQPGPEGSDVAPYSFIPSLRRGNRETQYAFTDVDESGVSHAFETNLHFALPPDLVPPGEEVSEAYVWIVYSFDFTGFGDGTSDPGMIACHEILEPWIESDVSWLNRPAYGPAFDAQSGINQLGLVWCDVTLLVDAWARGTKPNFGIALTNPTPRLIGFYSFEATTVDANLRPGLVVETLPIGTADADADGVANVSDNCRILSNPDQADADLDGTGDACDVCPGIHDPTQADADLDGIGDRCDFTAADLTGEGIVDEADLLEFVRLAASGAGVPFLDLDDSGVVDTGDLALWLGIHGTWYTGPTAGAACGQLSTAMLIPYANWWVEHRARPTDEFMSCYDVP